MSRVPIRLRLTLVFASVMALVLAGVGVFLYLRLGATLDERIADNLESRSAALASIVRSGGVGEVDPSLLAGEEGVAQVVGPEVTGMVALAGPSDHVVLLTASELASARRRSVTTEHDGYRVRADPVGERVVAVGEPLDDREEALSALLTQLLVVLPIALLVSSAIGYLVAGAALRPVEAMRLRATEISPDTPEHRLPLPAADDEVRRLGETLNEMLDRLDAGLERERRFVSDASHELRTPLALLKAELELALRRTRSRQELEDALRSAAAETDRLVQLAEDLLLVSRADQGKLPVRREPVQASGLLADVKGRFDGRAGGRAIEVEGSDALVFSGDPDRMGQALGNLVDNALRYGGGTVRISAHRRGGRVELHVTDEGTGFPPEFLPRAFERFSRHDDARGRGGTGLGLALVAAIAQAHGGSAHAANKDGGGADVWVSLPSENGGDAARRDREDVG